MSSGPRRLVAGMLALTPVLIVTAVLVPRSFPPLWFVPALAMAAFLLASLVGQQHYGPARFVVRDGTFGVPTNRAYAFQLSASLMSVAVLSTMVVAIWRFSAGTGAFRGLVTGLAVLATVVVGLIAAAIAQPVAAVLRGRPILALTPDGVRVRDLLGGRMFPWEALLPWAPAGGYDLRSVVLPVQRPELVERRGPFSRSSGVTLGFADVHPWFFADAVRFYVLHPERRAGIGTPEEHERLLADLNVPAVAPA